MGKCFRVVCSGRKCFPHEQTESVLLHLAFNLTCILYLIHFSTDVEAGKAFEKAANIQTSKLNEPNDAATTLTEAFKVYKKDSPTDAVRCLDVAINHWTSQGNFRRAATHKQNVAEVYEKDLGQPKKAIEAYELAASWFENDNAEAYASPIQRQMAFHADWNI